jgi:predicted transcriptional regulator
VRRYTHLATFSRRDPLPVSVGITELTRSNQHVVNSCGSAGQIHDVVIPAHRDPYMVYGGHISLYASMESTMDTLEKTTVYLPAEIRRQLAEVARRRHVTQANLIREALETFLGAQDRPPWRSLGAGHSHVLTGRTARDWLRENWQTDDHAG